MVWVARYLSNIISPPIMFALLGFALAFYATPFVQAAAWGALYGVLVSLVPILAVFYLLHTGRIAELHMSHTQERHLPYLIATLCAGAAFLLLTLFNGPELLRCLAAFNVVELIALGVINIRWLISIHATGMTATWLIAWLVFGWVAAVLLFPILLLVCWVRLFLKRHTPAQVVAGIGLGIISVLTLTAFGCFVM
jgi:membrane-associated phospholipid phosphatase